MTAKFNQDFITFKGDDVAPIFTVEDSAGNPVDISTVSEIKWYFQLTAEAGPIATRLKSLGQIAFTTDGTNGQFQVDIPSSITDLATVDGWYQHLSSITDGTGRVTTVAVGRMQVGVKPTWTYNAALVDSVPLFQVRRYLGDVIENDQQMLDSEILFNISQRSTVIGAAADCARQLAAQYSRKVDTVTPGGISTSYGTQAKKYMELALSLEALARSRGAGIMPYAGGISAADKWNVISNTDRVVPSFSIGMADNRFIPVAPAGEQQIANPNAGGNNSNG